MPALAITDLRASYASRPVLKGITLSVGTAEIVSVIGPSGSNVVIQASTDLSTWIPLQTNLLGSGPFQFSDPQSPGNARRFYRAQMSP